MAEKRVEPAIERRRPDIREHIDGVKFHTLAKGITTHPLVRSGRPCIEGTGILVTNIASLQNHHHMDAQQIADHLWLELYMAQDALNYYAEHTDYIDTELQLDDISYNQMVEAPHGDFTRELLSRRASIAEDS